jgi:hypothetical protein
MQIKQDFMLEIQDERATGPGTLASCRTVQRFALTQSFNRLPVVLAQSTEKTVVRTILLDGLRKVGEPLDDVPCFVRHGCFRRLWSVTVKARNTWSQASTYRVPRDVHCGALDTVASFRFGIVAVLFRRRPNRPNP